MPQLTDLPNELLAQVAQEIYDPLDSGEHGRLEGLGPFVETTGDVLADCRSLQALSCTSRQMRDAVRSVLLSRIHVPDAKVAEKVVASEWRVHVRTARIDVSAGYDDCWSAASSVLRLVGALPALENLCLTGISDNVTLALLASKLVPRRDNSAMANGEGHGHTEKQPKALPLLARLRSFGVEYTGNRHTSSQFTAASPILHHAPNVSHLLIRTSALFKLDDLVPLLRTRPTLTSLTILGHNAGFDAFVTQLPGLVPFVEELFLETNRFQKGVSNATVSALAALPNLRLLGFGYDTRYEPSATVALRLAQGIPSLLVIRTALDDERRYGKSNGETWSLWRTAGADAVAVEAYRRGDYQRVLDQEQYLREVDVWLSGD